MNLHYSYSDTEPKCFHVATPFPAPVACWPLAVFTQNSNAPLAAHSLSKRHTVISTIFIYLYRLNRSIIICGHNTGFVVCCLALLWLAFTLCVPAVPLLTLPLFQDENQTWHFRPFCWSYYDLALIKLKGEKNKYNRLQRCRFHAKIFSKGSEIDLQYAS